MFKNKTTKQIYLYTTLIAIFCNILWGSAFPALKTTYKEMNIIGSDIASNLTFISIRFFLAGAILFLIGLARKAPLFKISRQQWGIIILLGICNTTIQYFFFNIGVNNTSGIKGSILGQIGIFFSVILAHFIYKNDKLTYKKVLGLLLGFLGLIVVNLNKNSDHLFSFTLMGEGFMILSGLSSAIAMFIAKKIGQELPALVYTTWQMLIGSILLFVLGVSMGGNPYNLHFTPISTVLLLYLALLSSIAFLLWYTILQYRKIGELALFKFVVPLSGTILTALLVPGEKLLPVHILGLTLVSIGIVVVNYSKKSG